MKEENELDILIPVFNEDETIVKTIKKIKSVVKYNYNILICYDYDEDPTLKIIRENFLDDYKIVFVKNFSQGCRAGAKVVVFVCQLHFWPDHADLQSAPQPAFADAGVD